MQQKTLETLKQAEIFTCGSRKNHQFPSSETFAYFAQHRQTRGLTAFTQIWLGHLGHDKRSFVGKAGVQLFGRDPRGAEHVRDEVLVSGAECVVGVLRGVISAQRRHHRTTRRAELGDKLSRSVLPGFVGVQPEIDLGEGV